MVFSWVVLLIYLLLFFLGTLSTMDQIGYEIIHSLQSDQMTALMKGLTFWGSTIGVIGICVIALFFHQKIGLWIGMNVAVVALLNQIIKLIVARPRPSVPHLVVETSYSFPSAHAMVSMTLFGLIVYYLWIHQKHCFVFMIGIPIMIGITRIYLGVHYTSDVIAGFLFAVVYLCTMNFIISYHKKPSDS